MNRLARLNHNPLSRPPVIPVGYRKPAPQPEPAKINKKQRGHAE